MQVNFNLYDASGYQVGNSLADIANLELHGTWRFDYLNAFNGSLEASLNPEREIARAFFGQHGWPYLDLHALMSAEPQKYVLPEDGIHLNLTGHALFAQEMFHLLDGLLSGSRGA